VTVTDNGKERVAASDGADRGAAHFSELVAVMARLRGEGGCPWDREQTPASLKPNILEEAYELLDAIDGLGPAAHDAPDGDRPDDQALAHFREELGDLLLQVVFQAEIAACRGWFTIGEVAAATTAKLVRRHPHVFGDRSVSGPREALASWEAIKFAERKAKNGGGASALAGVPRELPALLRARRITEKAARVGFDWPDLAGVLAKVDEERSELAEALGTGDPRRIADEFGDLLFALVNLGRFLGASAEDALHAATVRFVARFEAMEERLAREGRDVTSADAAELDRLWEATKASEAPHPADR
jgi:MazG family protein